MIRDIGLEDKSEKRYDKTNGYMCKVFLRSSFFVWNPILVSGHYLYLDDQVYANVEQNTPKGIDCPQDALGVLIQNSR